MNNILTAQRLAWELRRDLEIDSRSFDLPELVRDMGIYVVLEKPVGSAEAMSLSLTRDFIFIDPRVSGGRQRFTLGHELGHILLDHGAFPCSAQDIHGVSKDAFEAAADAFSANLLLPSRLFRADIKPVHFQIDELSALADLYEVSLTATAIRFTQFTRDACAVIGYRLPDKTWIRKSDRAASWWFRLPSRTGTLISDHLNAEEAPSSAEVPAQVWIDEFPWRGECLIREEVLRTSPGTWLVLLSDLPDPDDDPDLDEREAEAELEARRSRFRRY